MARTAEALEGLALLGTATAGALTVSPPLLLVPEGHPLPAGVPGLSLRHEPSDRSGRRRYVLGDPTSGWRFELEIPTPEAGTFRSPVGTDGPVAFVRGPIGPEESHALARARPDLVALTNARALLREGSPFVESIRAIRLAVGARPLLWAPRVTTPNRLAFLVYVGVDLLDATESLLDAAEGRKADVDLGFVGTDRGGYCRCSGCSAGPSADLSTHNRLLLSAELARARAALADGRLRILVESRLPSEPLLGELLRYADRELEDLLEERTPVIAQGIRPYVIRDSFRRPEVRRYRRRFEERYRPPRSKSVLLLVPCSHTKPYRNSRSHRRFATAWEGLPRTERIHKVSVTSPLGVVPRELEDVPPARHYDISVTGEWDASERTAVLRGIEILRERGAYERIIVHLDPEEYDFLRATLPPGPTITWTAEVGRSTSPGSLQNVHEALEAALAQVLPCSEGPMAFVREEMRSIGEFQFGRSGSEALLGDPLRLHGRPWFQRLSDGAGTELATWREERGLFQLTAAGGLRMGVGQGNAVEVADGVDLRGDLFSPGVIGADARIRAGDAVVLHRKGAVLGVGEAVLPGPLMAALGRGCAVKVRHRTAHGVTGGSSLAEHEILDSGRSSSG